MCAFSAKGQNLRGMFSLIRSVRYIVGVLAMLRVFLD